ncbi:MAG: mechanosensitive ion channel family protein [Rhodococcus sp.]|nr:mechanosensitive ion channel family protein [Rhodococcus sp. (in: high G+C Gram-positive bacteria)]
METAAITWMPVRRAGDWLLDTGLSVVLTVLSAVLVVRFIAWATRRITDHIDANYDHGDELVRSEASKHRHSVAQVISWVIITIVWVLTVVQVVSRLGLPVTGLVAPATVLGAALGFGAQRLVQDILAGFFIITERQYGFGDMVRLAITGSSDDAEGVVEDVTLRVSRLRNADGEVITVPNGQILKAVNLSKDWARSVVDVPVPVSADLNRVNDALHQVCVSAYNDRSLKKLLLDQPSVMGVESISVDEVSVRMVARSLPGKQFQVGRELRVRIVTAMRRQGISVEPEMVADKGDEEAE